MSERLYYQDAYAVRFTAVITELVRENGRLAIVLDRSYFYPTSGGQPADRGVINDMPALDVTVRPEDGAVLHWVDGDGREIETGAVTAVIDWPRRFDHMQHHTGQHILSQAFIRTAQAQTVSFHLSDDTVTIDLDVPDLTPEQVRQAERLANQIVWENRPVHIRMATLEEARQMSLRKLPPVKNGQLRLIDIENFDLTACGGTHVARTGGVGLIKITRLERRRGQLRVEFRCGGRALADYGRKNETVARLVADLTTGQAELVTAVASLQTENKEASRTIKKLRAALLQVEAKRLLAAGQKMGGFTVVTRVFDAEDGANLRVLGAQLSQKPGVVALLGLAGSKSQLLFCRSDDAPGEMDKLLQAALQALGRGGGGGSPQMAQGGGAAADNGRLRQILSQIEQQLRQQIAG